ncbi:hypothetical protein D3870_10555 [Noviherbaspirillum cavernae]|uniref:Uncharacterized protein n=1 Tax=Noviherbaspirillum cavernae TaxID=2320862 RepID=A0A418X1R6_9BURK|nr:hypothetical protein [Noviherbaspirillum cavernae]RJG06394.1 hypothetical protein D3870_10555 [Noviherbaspirillum cavernae]
MSLINQMLQDLDARRSEVPGTGTYGSQVRVVGKRGSRTHIAWWIVLAVAVILAGVVAWLLLRPAPAASTARTENRPSTPVKAAAVPAPSATPVAPVAPVAPTASSQEKIDTATAPNVLPASDVKPVAKMVQAQVLTPPSEPPLASKQAAVQDKPAKSIKPAVSVPVAKARETAEEPIREQAHPAPRMAKLPEPSVPVALNKQVKESSPAQRADNEYRKALQLRQHGKTSDAVASLEQVLQLDAQHAAARQVLVGILLESRRQDDAFRRAREGLDIDPAQPGLAMIASRLQLEKGELRPAIDTLERSLRYALDRADYQAYLAALLQRDTRHKEAVEHYLVALQKSPQNGVWWMGLGISLQAEHRMSEAEEAFSRAKGSNSLSPELLAFVESKLTQLQR